MFYIIRKFILVYFTFIRFNCPYQNNKVTPYQINLRVRQSIIKPNNLVFFFSTYNDI